MPRILGEFNKKKDTALAEVRRIELARVLFNKLPYGVRTINAHEVYLSVSTYSQSAMLQFKYKGDDADEPASIAVGRLIKDGIEMSDSYSLVTEKTSHCAESWQRSGTIMIDEFKFSIRVTGFSRPIGYEIEQVEEVVPERVSSYATAKCNFK